MKIYHVSSAPYNGGAARAAWRLHEALNDELRVKSLWLDASYSVNNASARRLEFTRGQESYLHRLRRLKWKVIIDKLFTDTSVPAANPIGWGTIEMFRKWPKPDIWNLHWVAGFLDWEHLLPWMAEQAPVVWTLHDLNPLQGVWHFEPQRKEQGSRHSLCEARARAIKKQAISKVPKDRLVFVAPSIWIHKQCEESMITEGFSIRRIPNGLNTDIFRQRNKTLIRELYGIKDTEYVIGFVADHINAPRKGLHLLLPALRELAKKHDNVHLLTVGAGNIEDVGCNHTRLGTIENDEMLAHVYSACNVFVCPSTQDNLPNTVLESLSCKTPVVGFAVGGLPDLINSPAYGQLVSLEAGSQGLEEALSAMMAHGDHMIKSPDSFSLTARRQAKTYIDLYRNLLE